MLFYPAISTKAELDFGRLDKGVRNLSMLRAAVADE